MRTVDSSPGINALVANTGQPAVVQEAGPNDSMTGFFAIGIVINIVMVTAFFIWAYGQWKKSGKADE